MHKIQPSWLNGRHIFRWNFGFLSSSVSPPPPEIDIAPGNGPSQRKFHLPTVVFQMFLAVSFWGGILFSTTWATFKTLRWHSMKSWLLHDSILISWLMKYSLFNWVVSISSLTQTAYITRRFGREPHMIHPSLVDQNSPLQLRSTKLIQKLVQLSLPRGKLFGRMGPQQFLKQKIMRMHTFRTATKNGHIQCSAVRFDCWWLSTPRRRHIQTTYIAPRTLQNQNSW